MDEATLQRLVDRLDIQDTLTRYASSIDAREFDKLRTVFADDATALYDKDSGPLYGGDAIVAWVKGAVDDLDWQHHMISVQGVELDGDEASALIYLVSHQTVAGAPNQTRMMTSKYRNKVRRVAGRWVISTLELEVGWYEERDFPQAASEQATTEQEISA
jgi:hypothetical protein